ncbi:MAG: sugar ABC transporter permease [Deltaproteobacteria bacterium]|nr:sugar ABC transporter permease [Deltaproteobacteria bacterium]
MELASRWGNEALFTWCDPERTYTDRMETFGQERTPLQGVRDFLDRHFALTCILPTMILVFGLILVPIYLVFYESVFLDTPGQFRFVGLKHYVRIFQNPDFWRYLYHTVQYSGFSSLFSFLFGLILALSLNQKIRFPNFFRVWVLLPWAIPPVVAAFMFKWFFNDIYGAANDLLMKLGIIQKQVTWLASKTFAMPILIGVDSWIRIPFVTIILLAGLQAIPKDLYDAAKIDGAGTLNLFRNITWPYLKGPLLVAMVIVTAFSFRFVDIMMALTGGGPGDETMLFAVDIYKSAFLRLRFGYSAAEGVVMLAMIVVIILAYTYFLKSEVEE